MYLSGLSHRDQLFDIATRWLSDRVAPDDGRVLTEIFAFERAVTGPTVRRFVAELCRVRNPGELYLERVSTKDHVRQAIVAAATHPSPRVAELFDWYRQLPEEFFPRTPVHMSLVTRRNGVLAAVVRRKRIRRIADKVSRQVTAALSGMIDQVASDLAASWPRASREALPEAVRRSSTPQGALGAAERLVADRIRSGRLTFDPEAQRVDDVIGVKIIGFEDQLAAIEQTLDHLEHTRTFYREVHEGRYVGTHHLVELELPPARQLIDRMKGVDWSFAAGRGLDPADLEASFHCYVETGRTTFCVELILTTFEDLVESEFGSSIHEQRILDQRGRANEFGRIACNASSIIEYMLRLATSPTVNVDQLPIKLWGRYIRDTVAHAIASLDRGIPPDWLVPDERDTELMSI